MGDSDETTGADEPTGGGPDLRERLRAEALSTLERVEESYGPGPRLEPLPFGPRGHDPDEPPGTVAEQRALLAGVGGTVVVDDRADAPASPHVVLVKRTYADGWVSPGGAAEPGESLPTTAIRETEEETGLDIELTGLFYSRLVEHRYAAGDPLTVPMAVFTARATGGALADRPDHRLPDGRPELEAARWFPVADLPPAAVDRERIRNRLGE
ncbi:NUDIX domain-containing protein [Haloglomus litoreum]|uniref:NUDIX domain-containing protein n=1 Tax=Haloglomus litoreum TaxID=3034026 RepID=UPI0023E8BF33|nr:NUDIX domain-containing protein [Haloglomus sp. DT116]